jgi:phosphatidylserine decarboxylase
VPIAAEGWPFIFPAAALACILAVMGWWTATAILAAGALACLGFFRDPERMTPDVAGAVLAPADGKVMGIASVDDAWVGDAVRLSIFLSPLDVHINRTPIGGLVRSVEYAAGEFKAAWKAEASEVNERCTLALEADATRVAVRQIAGTLARRIVCRARTGDKLAAGQRYGLIRFGSRTDLFVPRDAALRVRVGDRVRGGESIVAMLGEAESGGR